MKEKRETERIPVELKVDWRSEGNFLFENATNISEHGIFLETENLLEPGTMLDLKFELPDSDQRVEALGEVIWINPIRDRKDPSLNPGMGIRFVNLREIDRDTIMALIKRLAVL